MANNNLEAYLEAILAAMEGGEIPEVPVPSWNIEKYLAAILGAEIAKKPLEYDGGTSSNSQLKPHGELLNTGESDWDDIRAALKSGRPCIVYISGVAYPILSTQITTSGTSTVTTTRVVNVIYNGSVLKQKVYSTTSSGGGVGA